MNKTLTITDEMLGYLTTQLSEVGNVRAIAEAMCVYYDKQQAKQHTGNRPYEPKCAIARNTRSPADDSQMRKMRARAWHEQGVVMIEPLKLPITKERDWLMQYAESQYGKRS